MKFAFLFLTKDNLLHPDIWKTYFKNIDHKKYNIYSHNKDPTKVDPFLNPIKNQIPTKWGTLSIVKATLNLLKTTLKDNNDMYILVSESTVPFKTFSYMEDYLKGGENYMDLIKYIPEIGLYKSSQWFILNKKTVEKILKVKDKYFNKTEDFSKLGAPDEFFFATLLKKEGIPIIQVQTTFVKWSKINFEESSKNLNELYAKFKKKRHEMTEEKIKKFKIEYDKTWNKLKDLGKHPITFDKITKDDLELFCKKNLLFGRKFSKKSDIGKYLIENGEFIGIPI